jgi:hypothetical protein
MITFKSKSSPAVMMYQEHAERILEVLNKNPARGVITAAEAPSVLAMLEKEVQLSKQHIEDLDIEHHADTTHNVDALDGDNAELPEKQHVGFGQRVYPLLQMLRAAATEGHDILWGV